MKKHYVFLIWFFITYTYAIEQVPHIQKTALPIVLYSLENAKKQCLGSIYMSGHGRTYSVPISISSGESCIDVEMIIPEKISDPVIDAIWLQKDKYIIQAQEIISEPEYIRYTKALLLKDLNVVRVASSRLRIHFVFKKSREKTNAQIKIYAYIPIVNTGMWTYPRKSCFMQSKNTYIGTQYLDGVLNEKDNYPENPQAIVPVITGCGHPDASCYIYVCNDFDTVYIGIDFLSDNTEDIRDCLTLTCMVQGKSIEFSSKKTPDYVKKGFGSSSHASYAHRMYEMAIPVKKLDWLPDGIISFTVSIQGVQVI